MYAAHKTAGGLGYDLAGFFARNSTRFRAEIETVLSALLGTT